MLHSLVYTMYHTVVYHMLPVLIQVYHGISYLHE